MTTTPAQDNFCAFILTHGRPNDIQTLASLGRYGYTGPVYFVVDDEDKMLSEYQQLYGDRVLVFSKDDIQARFDQADNFTDRRSVFYARNACWDFARQLGYQFFVQLDDDYFAFSYRVAARKEGDKVNRYRMMVTRSLDKLFAAMVLFVKDTNVATLAMSQGGDHFGGGDGNSYFGFKRKAMNSFVCNTEHPFAFVGRVNEDVNTYVSLGNKGELFLTHMGLQLNQTATQVTSGGMTELYRDGGTYIKSFYTVMYAPSCVQVRWTTGMQRLHHRISWNHAVPCVLHEKHRKQNA
jgi:hypothetical protein